MAAQHVSDSDFDEIVLKSQIPVLVDFFAIWCGPCKMAAPILDELSDTYAGKVKIVKVDVDQNQISGNYGVMSIPTVVAFKNGEEVKDARIIGFGGKEGYENLIKKLLAE
jgi:thioredoxin 1